MFRQKLLPFSEDRLRSDQRWYHTGVPHLADVDRWETRPAVAQHLLTGRHSLSLFINPRLRPYYPNPCIVWSSVKTGLSSCCGTRSLLTWFSFFGLPFHFFLCVLSVRNEDSLKNTLTRGNARWRRRVGQLSGLRTTTLIYYTLYYTLSGQGHY